VGAYELHFANAPGANEHGLLIDGVPKTETITTGDLDSYTFIASAGSLVDVSLLDIDATALRPTFYLYGPTGDYPTYGGGNEEAVLAGYQVGSTGTYTLLISDTSFGGAVLVTTRFYWGWKVVSATPHPLPRQDRRFP